MVKNKTFGALSGVVGVLLLAGCGGAAASVSTPSGTSSGSGSTAGPRGNGFRQPGVSGVIASHTGSTATVNSTSGQSSTVTWTSSTSIIEQRQATQSALTNGACVAVRSQGAGFGGAGGARPSGRPSGFPSGRPSDVRPSGTRSFGTFTIPSKVTANGVTIEQAAACGTTGSRSGGGGFGGFAGKVSNRSATGFTLTVTVRASASGTSSAAPTTSTKKVAVTTNSSTTYTSETKGSGSSVVPGECMTALGTESGSKLAARQIIVSQSVNGTCDSGFSFGGRGAGSGDAGANNA